MGMRPVRPLVCERVRGQISVGLDGELSQLERAMIASHLERCGTCREYQGEVSCFTQVIREAPLEPMARAITIQRRRRDVGTRVQVAAAAAVAVAALVGASQALRGQQLDLDPTFVPAGCLADQLPDARAGRARTGDPRPRSPRPPRSASGQSALARKSCDFRRAAPRSRWPRPPRSVAAAKMRHIAPVDLNPRAFAEPSVARAAQRIDDSMQPPRPTCAAAVRAATWRRLRRKSSDFRR